MFAPVVDATANGGVVLEAPVCMRLCCCTEDWLRVRLYQSPKTRSSLHMSDRLRPCEISGNLSGLGKH